ncbi:S24 family peptidase, partial [Bacteroidota bacterium]
FAEINFKSKAELARKLGMRPQAFQSYLDGRSYPGGQILAKLSDLGCDINWLLTGEATNDTKYVPVEEAEKIKERFRISYLIAGVVPAGRAEIHEYNDWYEHESIEYDKANHVFLRIDEHNGYSMMPLIEPGDLVLIDLNTEPKDGDIVAARWDESGGAIKILSIDEDNPDRIALSSYNQSIKPLFKEKCKVVLYKVVMIKKKN